MKAEIVAVGTELLLGQIVNTNAQFLSRELAALGIDVYYQTVVGDNLQRLRQAIEIARERADLVLFTGGIGPTQDDLTKDALASYLGRTLHIHAPSMDKIERMFLSRGANMVESNRRQALMIDGSDPLPNETGLAVGNALIHDGTAYMLLPGPPKEMKPMFEHEGKRWLQQRLLTNEMPLFSRMLKFAGIGESSLEAKLIDLIEGQSDTTIAPYAQEGEVTIRLSTKARTVEEASAKLDVLETEIRGRLGAHLYAAENVAIEQVIVERMSAKDWTLSAAESCTGGLLSEMITAIPGSSRMFAGGIVCYSNALKEQLLNVPHAMLEGETAPGAVSAETAQTMAEQMRTIADTDLAVAITGVAGPGASERKPVGLVYIAIAQKGEPTQVEKLQLSGGREMIRLRTVKTVLYHLWRRLN
ncbi:competence/damage-inducible protein A [Paenibacillus sp. MSJ-34]|uniref:competence/damage-inducible protein A n=1 Tax=Paenibacillus sp. MSJ-34 TaxID=2841529 RepID=UPI001C111E34|nr:competence/damage-inducible protein A [Paenibacillus sp. MSJ-34]MBU5441837.1 competence/damage-inducible protein A [Paenibacillus sp. MSJ-34]